MSGCSAAVCKARGELGGRVEATHGLEHAMVDTGTCGADHVFCIITSSGACMGQCSYLGWEVGCPKVTAQVLAELLQGQGKQVNGMQEFEKQVKA